MSERIGRYKLGKVLVSSDTLVERRALDMDPGGTPVGVVSLCGLHVGADGDAGRDRLVAALRDWQERGPLPHTPRVIEVLDHAQAPGFDAVVVSELHPGCPLSELTGQPEAPSWDPTLCLYVLSRLCETVMVALSAPQPPPGLGSLDALSVWIDRQATVTLHNPFLGLALRVGSTDEAAHRKDDVAAMQDLLRRLLAADETPVADTPVARAVTGLLDLERQEAESASAFTRRFAKRVKGLAAEHDVGQAGGVASLALAALGGAFDGDARSNRPTRPDSGVAPPPRRASGTGALADFTPETDVDIDVAATPLHLDEPESRAATGIAGRTPDPLALDTWMRYAIAAVVSAVVLGLGLMLGNGVPALSPSTDADASAAEGFLDLRSLMATPADTRLYLSLPDADRMIRLPAGVHELELRTDGQETRTFTVEVVAGETVAVPESVVLATSRTPARGSLDLTRLTTIPDDVLISLDGQPLTAGTVHPLPVGRHTLSFTRNGYVAQTREVVVEAGDSAALDETVRLSAAIRPGTINVGASLPVEIFEDDVRLGVTPFTRRFPPGPHVLEFRHDGLSIQLGYQVEPFETIDVTMQLTRVNSTPFSDVSIRLGGTRVAAGSTPGRVLAPVGAALVFTHPELGQREVVPEPGQDAVSVSFAGP